MTYQELYDYIENNIHDHINLNGEEYLADLYVKNGFGQIRGGYFDYAYEHDEKICKKNAEPSQKWHLLESYIQYKLGKNLISKNENAKLHRIMCPQLMIWISEIAGLNKDLLKSAITNAIKYETNNKTKDSRKIKYAVLNQNLHWEKICNIIKTKNTWEEIVKEISSIK